MQNMEREVTRLYKVVLVCSSGATLTSKEKYAAIVQKLNEKGKECGWPEITTNNKEIKFDALRRKGRKEYCTFRTQTRTGAPVEDDFDLKVSSS